MVLIVDLVWNGTEDGHERAFHDWHVPDIFLQ